ncbi:MAG: DNA mismatch repair protein MutS [Defluviitaleaceae bacterium]|nr:DNA mismatch repair protein MutS [Defluviitaleaceae bacterium]MCL2262717.1 DNA mismatch repair protein MutS [Defluviitaleaceae bacterium]
MPKLTPMMEQYFAIKANHKDAILMFRLGDFFEIFFEDAKIAAKELDIALTGRDCGQEERAPMCGVPAHAVDGYIAKLVEKGYRVALCDQVEDAKQAKGIVKRDVIRVVTPGTITDANFLEEGRHNYIVAVSGDKSGFSVASADITTGLFMATFVGDENKLPDELSRINPAEVILPENFPLTRIVENFTGVKATTAPAWTFHHANAKKTLVEHFGTMHLEGFGIADNAAEIPAAGALLAYLSDTQRSALSQITRLKIYAQQTNMLLDSSSRRNLELTASSKDRGKKGSLLWVLDRTKTAAGARLLRNWVDLPLMHTEEIRRRLDAVEEWTQMPIERAELREYLHGIHDLERLMARLSTRYGTARDLATLRASTELLPAIERLLTHTKCAANKEIRRTFDDLSDIYEKIDKTITEAPPATVREGGMIRPAIDTQLDELRNVKQNAQGILEEMEAREKQETGITSLKIRYNRVFGYYIEVTAANLSRVPEKYIRRQTLANCERFVTEELKNLEETLLGADEKIIALEFEIFDAIRREIVDEMARVQFAASVLATLDVLQSLAETAEKNGYVKPAVTNGTGVKIKDGRHPVVEKLTTQAFVPNDTEITSENRLAIITGPNMAGKSTYMRQVALIVLMAQIGSFVPATAAEIGVVDRIFTRVGASDDLATGQSTFMVEMTEVANILNNATQNSLVLLDEIGRGTSTFDGLSIAWAVLEHIADAKILGAKTLFATHYHELTRLEGKLDGVINYCFTAQEQGENIVFLRKLIHGEAGQSYGIHVARLAGLPPAVLSHATDLLDTFNTTGVQGMQQETRPAPHPQKDHPALSALREIEVEKITPLDALMALGKLKELL